jgi:hypothetical protein
MYIQPFIWTIFQQPEIKVESINEDFCFCHLCLSGAWSIDMSFVVD